MKTKKEILVHADKAADKAYALLDQMVAEHRIDDENLLRVYEAADKEVVRLLEEAEQCKE